MIQKIAIGIGILCLVSVVDFIVAFVRGEFPFSFVLHAAVKGVCRFLTNVHRIVPVKESMSAAEALALSKKKRPLFKVRNGDKYHRGIYIHNDTYDKFYSMGDFDMAGIREPLNNCSVILPRPKYFHSSKEPKFNDKYASGYFELEEVDAAYAVDYVVGGTRTSVFLVASKAEKFGKDTNRTWSGLIYNDLDYVVTIQYLGSCTRGHGECDYTFTLKPGEFIVIEGNAKIKLVDN